MSLMPGALGTRVLGTAEAGPLTKNVLEVRVGPFLLTSKLKYSGYRIRDDLNQRNTASIELIISDPAYRPAIGQPITLWLDGGRIFAGIINEIEEELIIQP